MKWEDERWIKVYTRDTASWIVLSWEARALFLEVLRKVDRAGAVSLGGCGTMGLAAVVRFPVDVTERALAELVARGQVVTSEDAVTVPNFIDAQEARSSSAARKRAERERRDMSHAVTRGHANADSVTPCDDRSQNVTKCHAESHEVTRSHTASRSEQNRTEQNRLRESAPEAAPTSHEPAVEAPKRAKPKPSTSAPPAPAEVAAWLAGLGVPALDDAKWGREVTRWLDHHRAKGSRFVDWAAAWRTWRSRAEEYSRGSLGLPGTQNAVAGRFRGRTTVQNAGAALLPSPWDFEPDADTGTEAP